MEGLEVSEVDFKEICCTDLIRLESEFYTAPTFKLDSYFLGKDIIDFVQYGTSKELNEERKGYPILRLNEFNSSFISSPSKYCNIIDQETFESLKLCEDDVLICRTNGNPNYVGKTAIVPNDTQFAYASYLFKIRPKAEIINSATLVTYLNSKYGRIEIEKYSMASNQVNFSPAKFRQLRIPHFNSSFNSLIKDTVYKSNKCLTKSQATYQSAEDLLLEEIGLKHFTPSNEGINVKSFSDSFKASGRLDAEYYQPKYEQVVECIKQQNYDTLDNVVTIKKSIEPGSAAYAEEGLPFIRVADYSKHGITTPQKHLSSHYVKDNQKTLDKLKLTKGTMLFSKDGSVGTAYHLRESIEGITSGAILHLNVKDNQQIIPEYLTLVLNSQLVQMQSERDAGGSIILHWRVSEIENVVIPIIDETKQQHIATLIEESFALKAQSERLLEVAKRAVEIAIEQDETTALDYIKGNG